MRKKIFGCFILCCLLGYGCRTVNLLCPKYLFNKRKVKEIVVRKYNLNSKIRNKDTVIYDTKTINDIANILKKNRATFCVKIPIDYVLVIKYNNKNDTIKVSGNYIKVRDLKHYILLENLGNYLKTLF